MIELYSSSVCEQGIRLITSSLRRVPLDSLPPMVKSLNYLNNILARSEATRAGAQEAILLNHRGLVAECSGDNLFLLREGRCATPPISAGILPGITRGAVIEISRDQLKLPFAEADCSLYDLYSAEEVFLTGTGAEVIGVTEIDGRKIGSGRTGHWTREIQKLYKKMTRSTGVPFGEFAESRI
jgi:branched-chain amino acid aminotransferase